jgi:hypothetical protein
MRLFGVIVFCLLFACVSEANDNVNLLEGLDIKRNNLQISHLFNLKDVKATNDPNLIEARKVLSRGQTDLAMTSYESYLTSVQKVDLNNLLYIIEALTFYDYLSLTNYARGLVDAWKMSKEMYLAIKNDEEKFENLIDSVKKVDIEILNLQKAYPDWAYVDPFTLLYIQENKDNSQDELVQDRVEGEFSGRHNDLLKHINRSIPQNESIESRDLLGLIYVYTSIKAIDESIVFPWQKDTLYKNIFSHNENSLPVTKLGEYFKYLKKINALEVFILCKAFVNTGIWKNIKVSDDIANYQDLEFVCNRGEKVNFNKFKKLWRDATAIEFLNKMAREQRCSQFLNKLIENSFSNEIKTKLQFLSDFFVSNKATTNQLYRKMLFDYPCVRTSADTLIEFGKLDGWFRTPNVEIQRLYADWLSKVLYTKGYIITNTAYKTNIFVTSCAKGEVSKIEFEDAKARAAVAPEWWKKLDNSIKIDLGE